MVRSQTSATDNAVGEHTLFVLLTKIVLLSTKSLRDGVLALHERSLLPSFSKLVLKQPIWTSFSMCPSHAQVSVSWEQLWTAS